MCRERGNDNVDNNITIVKGVLTQISDEKRSSRPLKKTMLR